MVPKRRTAIVLVTLVGAMTITSMLLMALEPAPLAQRGPISLQAIEQPTSPEQILFTTERPIDKQWRSVVIQFSGADYGSAEWIGNRHELMGHEGLAYHFVVNNGNGGPDGRIEMGYRWLDQELAPFSSSDGEVISICLVGDGRRYPPTRRQLQQLIWLVHCLQREFGIPADRVHIGGDSTSQIAQAGLFPVAQFRQQLLTPTSP